MLNKSGITKTQLTNTTQILANVEFQMSVGCVVKKDATGIVKAGTPLKIDLSDLATPAEIGDASTHAANAILLHDVDATAGNANGTALIWGFVNVNRIDATTYSKLESAITNAKADLKSIKFLKV